MISGDKCNYMYSLQIFVVTNLQIFVNFLLRILRISSDKFFKMLVNQTSNFKNKISTRKHAEKYSRWQADYHILKAKLKVNGGKLFSHTFSLNNKGKPIIR